VAVAAEARYLTSCRLPGSPGVEAGSRGC
jgi:hypothetical protein